MMLLTILSTELDWEKSEAVVFVYSGLLSFSVIRQIICWQDSSSKSMKFKLLVWISQGIALNQQVADKFRMQFVKILAKAKTLSGYRNPQQIPIPSADNSSGYQCLQQITSTDTNTNFPMNIYSVSMF